MKEYTNKELEKFLEKAEGLDWSYNLYKEDDNCIYVEMEKYSPLGEDYSMIIYFDKEDSVNTFMDGLKEYYLTFDPDDHAAMWIENRGKNGTPDSIRDLLDDAKNIKEMIGELIRYLEDVDDEKDMQNTSSCMEMNVGYLKDVIKDLPDDMPVFVACQGYCNYNFDSKQPFEGTDTFGIVHDGKLFITDDCFVERRQPTDCFFIIDPVFFYIVCIERAECLIKPAEVHQIGADCIDPDQLKRFFECARRIVFDPCKVVADLCEFIQTPFRKRRITEHLLCTVAVHCTCVRNHIE